MHPLFRLVLETLQCSMTWSWSIFTLFCSWTVGTCSIFTAVVMHSQSSGVAQGLPLDSCSVHCVR